MRDWGGRIRNILTTHYRRQISWHLLQIDRTTDYLDDKEFFHLRHKIVHRSKNRLKNTTAFTQNTFADLVHYIRASRHHDRTERALMARQGITQLEDYILQDPSLDPFRGGTGGNDGTDAYTTLTRWGRTQEPPVEWSHVINFLKSDRSTAKKTTQGRDTTMTKTTLTTLTTTIHEPASTARPALLPTPPTVTASSGTAAGDRWRFGQPTSPHAYAFGHTRMLGGAFHGAREGSHKKKTTNPTHTPHTPYRPYNPRNYGHATAPHLPDTTNRLRQSQNKHKAHTKQKYASYTGGISQDENLTWQNEALQVISGKFPDPTTAKDGEHHASTRRRQPQTLQINPDRPPTPIPAKSGGQGNTLRRQFQRQHASEPYQPEQQPELQWRENRDTDLAYPPDKSYISPDPDYVPIDPKFSGGSKYQIETDIIFNQNLLDTSESEISFPAADMEYSSYISSSLESMALEDTGSDRGATFRSEPSHSSPSPAPNRHLKPIRLFLDTDSHSAKQDEGIYPLPGDPHRVSNSWDSNTDTQGSPQNHRDTLVEHSTNTIGETDSDTIQQQGALTQTRSTPTTTRPKTTKPLGLWLDRDSQTESPSPFLRVNPQPGDPNRVPCSLDSPTNTQTQKQGSPQDPRGTHKTLNINIGTIRTLPTRAPTLADLITTISESEEDPPQHRNTGSGTTPPGNSGEEPSIIPTQTYPTYTQTQQTTPQISEEQNSTQSRTQTSPGGHPTGADWHYPINLTGDENSEISVTKFSSPTLIANLEEEHKLHKTLREKRQALVEAQQKLETLINKNRSGLDPSNSGPTQHAAPDTRSKPQPQTPPQNPAIQDTPTAHPQHAPTPTTTSTPKTRTPKRRRKRTRTTTTDNQSTDTDSDRNTTQKNTPHRQLGTRDQKTRRKKHKTKQQTQTQTETPNTPTANTNTPSETLEPYTTPTKYTDTEDDNHKKSQTSPTTTDTTQEGPYRDIRRPAHLISSKRNTRTTTPPVRCDVALAIEGLSLDPSTEKSSESYSLLTQPSQGRRASKRQVTTQQQQQQQPHKQQQQQHTQTQAACTYRSEKDPPLSQNTKKAKIVPEKTTGPKTTRVSHKRLTLPEPSENIETYILGDEQIAHLDTDPNTAQAAISSATSEHILRVAINTQFRHRNCTTVILAIGKDDALKPNILMKQSLSNMLDITQQLSRIFPNARIYVAAPCGVASDHQNTTQWMIKLATHLTEGQHRSLYTVIPRIRHTPMGRDDQPHLWLPSTRVKIY